MDLQPGKLNFSKFFDRCSRPSRLNNFRHLCTKNLAKDFDASRPLISVSSLQQERTNFDKNSNLDRLGNSFNSLQL
ncbi:hypothetical protein EUGRSUZ_D02401 [Eucalyptus grandis]|uniref:Uncharacterized protein n=2 Tax=Eucalyptus grandis TaxID=71139 RepID=A0ACC3L7Y9_EUCGR|nr:hypothetical protein EUGRSUZ_D02401 [Eucalyptus grandis]